LEEFGTNLRIDVMLAAICKILSNFSWSLVLHSNPILMAKGLKDEDEEKEGGWGDVILWTTCSREERYLVKGFHRFAHGSESLRIPFPINYGLC